MNKLLLAAWILATIVATGGCDRERASAPDDKKAAAPDAEKAAAPDAKKAVAPDVASNEMLVASDPPHESPAGCTLCVSESFILKVDKAGNAVGDIRICNISDVKIPLDLRLAEFKELHRNGVEHALGADRSFKQPDGQPLPTHIEKGCKTVRIELAKFGHAHATAAKLYNNDIALIDITAARFDVPFEVKIDGPTPQKANIAIVEGRGRIKLRNEDPNHYRFRWHLEIPGAPVAEGVGDIPPKAWTEIPVTYPSNFLESGFLRSSNEAGKLTLEYEPAPYHRSSIVAPKSFDVSARISHFAATAQRLGNYGFILAVLLLGIVLSMLVNFFMPTERSRIEIRDQLAALEGSLKSLDEVVDPRRLTLLRVEKRRLREALRDLWPILPQTAIDLPVLKQRVEALARRIALTVRAGKLLDAMNTSDKGLSVIEARDIVNQCEVALAVAANEAPTADEEKAAGTALQTAAALLANADAAPDPAYIAALRSEQTRIAGEIASLPSSIDAWPKEKDGDDHPAAVVRAMLATLKADFAPSEPSSERLTRAQFTRAAKAVANATAMVDFVRLVLTAQDDKILKQRLGRLNDLVAAIKPGAGTSLEVARNIVRQVDQNVSVAEILNALEDQAKGEPGSAGSFWLETDPPTPLPLQVVILRVRARDPGFDTAAAHDEIGVAWTVGGERQVGIRTWHTAAFFAEDPRWYHPIKWLRARMSASKAHVIEAVFEGSPPLNLEWKVPIEPRKSYGASRLVLSLASLLITLLLVSLGLMAGAQEKLESVDWLTGFIAVLVVGYTANSIKSAITK